MSTTVEYTSATVQALSDASKAHSVWVEQGRALAKANAARQFEIGDWLLAGEERLKKKAYAEAQKIFRYERSTLKLFAHVARNVPALVRTNDLPWEHHKLVARFKPEIQKQLLDYAVKVNGTPSSNMTVDCFRKHVNQQYPPTKKAAKPSAIRITLSDDLRDAVERFANAHHEPVDKTVCHLVELALEIPEVADFLAKVRALKAAA